MHVGGVIGTPRLELFGRPDHRFNFVVKAIKTVAAQNYEVLANVTQNNISIVWKCQRKACFGEQRSRCSRHRREDAGIKDLRVANLNEKQRKERHQGGEEAFKMTFRVIDPMQVTV